ncbi:MAG: bifunctional precorrin-2 dehydrogenase/sirohydrochlorin ferrochelatase, partial [Deltaproteobacteria bacterium]|nr:bifunctional precorrin-2 dehydrogenase/sirohydrochlorin ferrochelatase [Deltaproteobacteria bacterium]
MKLYPVMLNIEGRLAVIVGGGSVACRKLQDLLEAGAVVRLIAPDVDDEIAAFAAERGGQVEIMHRRYCSGDLAGSALVFSATDDPETNRQVGDDARRAGLFVNTADDLENSSLIIPSVTRRGELIMALSTSG